MKTVKDAFEMRELLLDYIDALLLGGIPQLNLDGEPEEQTAEESAAAMAAAVKQMSLAGRSEYQLMLDGILILYKELRGTATERCYELFWQVQQMKSVRGQLERCFDMLRMLNIVLEKPNNGAPTSAIAAAFI